MATVTNLKLALQPGTSNTLFATWEFKASSPSSSQGGGGSSGGGGGGSVSPGSIVTVNRGSKWYNGVTIAPFVFNLQWRVSEVRGQRVVINESTDGSHRIMSPIHINNLTVVSRSRTMSTSQVTTKAASPDTLDHYEVKWYYTAASGSDAVWFDGGSSNVTLTNATYGYPDNAVRIKVTVKPIAKTYDSNGNSVPYWTGKESSLVYLISELPPNVLSAPAATLDKYKLTAKIENIEDAKCESVEFEVYKDDTRFTTGTSEVKTARASFTCNITAGGKYRVRIRAINYVGGAAVYGPWSPYSSESTAVPSIPQNVRCAAETKTSVKVTWNQDTTATGYTVEYVKKKEYFDGSNQSNSITVTLNYAIITGIEAGSEWYFRVKATNSEGDSGWSDIVYCLIGTKPQAPTTWSLSSTAIIGDPVTLYWVHNTQDGSKQNEAQIELTVNGQAKIITIDTSKDASNPDIKEKIYSYNVDLTPYPDGAEILWRIRTRGITFEYSDWSVQRSINTYAPPTATLALGDGTGILKSFPYSINVSANPASQNAVSYHISIVSQFAYETENNVGETVMVNAGDEVFSKVFIFSDNKFSFDLMPEHVSLANNQGYKVVVTVAMNSGLVAETSGTFTVTWADVNYRPDASVVIDKETYSAYINPFCINLDTNELIPDTVLAVYRREYDGTFTLISKDIENYGSITVTDPHPSLDFARYRIVARNRLTSEVGFSDIPGIPVKEPAIIIQWDEKWTQFDYSENAEPEIKPWTGSLLRLPYNVDTSEQYSPDVAMIEYTGRKHPIAYYGTQRGVSASWNTVIPKTDKETIYALRRLSEWTGDVYVREPSGNGYKAQITVSMSFKHKELTVPVSFSVVRVDGDEA